MLYFYDIIVDFFILLDALYFSCGLFLVHLLFFPRFVKGCRPGHQTGFDIDGADLGELEQFHDVIVASAVFGTVGHKKSFIFKFFFCDQR